MPIGPKDHTQKRYYIMCNSLLPMGGRGKSLSGWMRLGRAKRSHAKDGTLSLVAYERDR